MATPSDGTPSRYTTCWACHVTVEVPRVKNEWAAEFKCGWCGAVTNMKPISSKARHGLLLSSTSGKKAYCFMDLVVCSLQVFTVGFVVSLLLTIMTVGFFGLLPNLYHDPQSLFWNQLITVFLSMNISVNYFLAAFKGSRSKNAELPSTEGHTVPKGFYDNYRYCVPCQSVKLPGAHHCRTCNACIDDMDHHCPFIGNCVGKRNLHNFLLFLFWTGIGAMYAMLVCILIVVDGWPMLTKRQRIRHRTSYVSFTLAFTNSLPWWILAALYMLVVCFTGSIGVFVLLSSQMQQIRRGETYIESLKSGKSSSRQDSTFMRLAHVFGSRNPILWLFPFFGSRRMAYENVDCKSR